MLLNNWNACHIITFDIEVGVADRLVVTPTPPLTVRATAEVTGEIGRASCRERV